MADQIGDFFDMDGFNAQQKAIVIGFQQVFTEGKKLQGLAITPGSGAGMQESISMQKENAKTIDDLTKKVDALNVKLKEKNEADKIAAKAAKDADKAAKDKVLTLKQEQKAVADAANEYKQLSAAYNEAALRAKNLQIVAPDSKAAKEATKDAAELGTYLKKLDDSVGQHQRNVGNYAGALTGYANTLRGLRGPTKLLAEAFGISAMEADQFRLVIEHSLQGLAAYFRGKTATTVATTADTVATEAATVAQEEQTVATGAATEAIIAEGVAAEGAEVATGGLIAMLAPFIAVIAVFAVIVKIFIDYANAAKNAAIANKELYESKIKLVEGVNEQIKAENNKIAINRRSIEDELSNAEKSGQSQEKIFALKKKLNDFDLQNSVTQRITHNATNEGYNIELKQIDIANEKLDRYNKRLETVKQHKLDMADKNFISRWTDFSSADTEDNLKPFIEEAKAKVDFHQKQADQTKGLLEKDANAKREGNVTLLEETKVNLDVEAKILAAHNTQMYDARKAHNDRIANDERSTYAQKREAMIGNLNAEISFFNTEKDAQKVLLDRNVITLKDYNAAIAAIDAKRNLVVSAEKEAERKALVDETNKNNAALLAIDKNNYEAKVILDEATTKNTEKELDVRLLAYADSLKQKAALLEEEYLMQLGNAKKTGKSENEIAAITSNNTKAKVALTANSEKEVYDITKNYLEKKAKDIEESNKGTSNSGNTESYQKASEALNASLHNNIVSYSEYTRKKKQLDEQYFIDSDTAQVNDDQKKLSALEANQIDIAQLEIGADATKLKALEDGEALNNAKILNAKEKLAADKKKLSDAEVANELTGKKKLAELEKQLAKEVVTFVKTAIDAGYDNKVNAIEKQIAITDTLYANEIAAVSKSSLSQQDKAALEIQLQAQKQAADKNAANEEKKLKREKAKIDKEIAIAQIIMATGVAVMNSIKEFPGPVGLAIAVTEAAIGAVQLATVVATPLPSYALGTNFHPGGDARFGEAGAELIKEPNKAPWIAYTETIGYLPRGTEVVPLSADIRGGNTSSGLSWEQVKYLGAVIKKSNKPVNNVINTSPSIFNIDFDIYYNQKLKGYN